MRNDVHEKLLGHACSGHKLALADPVLVCLVHMSVLVETGCVFASTLTINNNGVLSEHIIKRYNVFHEIMVHLKITV